MLEHYLDLSKHAFAYSGSSFTSFRTRCITYRASFAVRFVPSLTTPQIYPTTELEDSFPKIPVITYRKILVMTLKGDLKSPATRPGSERVTAYKFLKLGLLNGSNKFDSSTSSEREPTITKELVVSGG